jgi:N-acetylglucosamine-6-phosphate deacetylase
MIAITTAHLFDGTALGGPRAVVISGERIVELAEVPPPGATTTMLPPGTILAPGFIDMQVNGGDGVLFNDSPTLAGLQRIAEAHARLGTTALLPTLISPTRAMRRDGVTAVRAALAAGLPGIAGIHLEGPYLARARRGIHPEEALAAPSDEDIAFVCGAPSVCMMTVAPEIVPPERIAVLVDAGVIVSLGHTEADLETVNAALTVGAQGFTHLFNAMSQLTARAPGAVGAALDDQHAFAGIIADGLHVHPAAIRLAWLTLGSGRLALISDAMPSVGTDPPAGFVLNGQRISLNNGRLTDPAGTLAGAHLTMAGAVQCAAATIGLPRADALRMATATPADILGLRDRGRIAPGLRADLVALDAELRVVAVWQGGRRIT